MIDGAVAVLTFDLDVVAVLAVDLAVPVLVLREVTVDAVHPLLEMDVAEVHGLLEFVGIVERDARVVRVEQVAFAIALEDSHEVPTVAVIVGELRLLRLRVQRRDFLQEIDVGP